jgi:hypothetical protein
MKGTPFYTGEYSTRRGPAEDRVNLWPAFYYRQPAMSVLWPIGEKTDDHLAIRPLMSVYGLDEGERIWSFLWPLSQFDFQAGHHRIFPFFWGKDYFCGFPLYWHRGHPLGASGGTDALLPLWWYNGDSSTYSAWFAGPLIHMKNRGGEKGWHVFPIAGNYRENSNCYRFLAWPLFHQWSHVGGTERGSALLPLYFSARDENRSRFLSLLYSTGRTRTDDERWDLLLPFYFKARDRKGSRFISPLYATGENAAGDDAYSLMLPLYFNRKDKGSRTVITPLGGYRSGKDQSSWFALPALSGGRSSPESADTWILGPLAHRGRDGRDTSSHVAPLFYRSQHDEDSLFVSLPWSARRSPESSWSLIPPLFYHTRSKDMEAFITPLYSRGSSSGGKSRWSALTPLYYSRQDDQDRLMTTLLGGWRTTGDGRRWLIYPLLSWGSHEGATKDFWALAPFFHSRTEGGKVTQQHLLPLFYRSQDPDTFLSPLFGRWENDRGGRTTLVPPLLSYYGASPQLNDFWSLAGLAHFSSGPDAGPEHLLPLYYRNRKTGTFLSMAYTRWGNEQQSTGVIPPALSWITRRPDCNDLWLVGPLAHLSWGPDAETDHILPFYYRNRKEETLISPLFARWKSGETRTALIPPLLSWHSTKNEQKDLNLMLGLARETWGTNVTRSGHLIPLYYHKGKNEFYTPLFGWDRDPDNGFFYPLTPLLGFWRGDSSGGWLFPLFSRHRDRQTQAYGGNVLWAFYGKESNHAHSWMFPFYTYDNRGSVETALLPGAKPGTYGKSFWCLPICWYDNEVRVSRVRSPALAARSLSSKTAGTDATVRCLRKNGCFPLWTYASSATVGTPQRETKASLLLLLYDYNRKIQPESPTSTPTDTTRARVLWRLWHYERANDDVSVDIFPAITYDRKGDAFKKVTFLWRFFRYERGNEGRKLDLLFLPVMRKQNANPG